MSQIKKFAAPLSLLSVLAAAFAAPYLIPENPDSAVFRSGSLGMILLLAAAFPVWEAFSRASRRQLVCGLAWGFLFAAALSIGSELFIYDGLLPGFGSLVRRMAVPVMTASLLGGLCARLMIVTKHSTHREMHLPFWAYFGVIVLCWLPVLLAYFPGMINYDFPGEYQQHLHSNYTNLHPLLHSAVINGVITLGEMIHSRPFGMLLMSLLQMALFAASLAYACRFAQKRGASSLALCLMTACFALHPVFSVMSVSMTKDTLFAAAVLMLSLLTWEAIESPDSFFASKRRQALYIFCAVNAALMRNNGVFALAFILPGLVISLRGFRRQAAKLSAACAGAAVLVTLLLNLALSPSSMPSFQLYSLPAQQLVRAYNSGKLSEEDRAEIAGWYTSEEGLIVRPHLGDSAKGYLDNERLEAEGENFLALWARVGKTCRQEYLEAFLLLNIGSWYPDDLSHSTIYKEAKYIDLGYLQTQEYSMAEEGFTTTCLLPAVRDFYEDICRKNYYQKYPVIAILFSTATPFWVMVFICALLVARKKTHMLPVALGALGLWLSYLFGPCTLPRYTLPLFCLAPPLLIAAFRKEDTP